jgi:hypothetical protein
MLYLPLIANMVRVPQKASLVIVHAIVRQEEARGSVVVKALCSKPEGRGLDTSGGYLLNLPNSYGLTRSFTLLILKQK